MQIDKLNKFNLPESVLRSWKTHQGPKLLPLQIQAVNRYGLLEGKSLLISSPTSSGKTFCGEMAAVAQLSRGGKVIYLVPLKAVAEEKHADFQQKYGQLGLRVLLSTSDHPENDSSLEKGDFDFAILVFEKFNQLLVKKLSLLPAVSLVIIDELQLIFDSSRGEVLENALCKLKSVPHRCQIIGLSSVLDNAGQLADWLGCQLLVQRERPVELCQGILWNGKFRYRSHNSGAEGEENSGWIESEQPLQTLFGNLERLVKAGEQVLVFLKSKAQVESAAVLFSERIKLPPASGALGLLQQEEPTSGRQRLLQSLQNSVAFHNADLTYPERKIVEQSYLSGEIKVIFCTTTLSLGVNLPAKTVFLEPCKYQNGIPNQPGILLPLEWSEYENISGRAGRLGQQDSGRAVMIAGSEFEAQRLWDSYLENKPFSPQGHLFDTGLNEVILDYLASKGAATLAELENYLQRTFTYQLQPLEFDLTKAVGELSNNGFIQSSCTGFFSATNLGRICATQNLSAGTVKFLSLEIEKLQPEDLLGTLYLLMNTLEARPSYPYLSPEEKKSRLYQKLLTKLISSEKTSSPLLKSLLEHPELLTPEKLQQIKSSFLLSDWIELLPLSDLEKKYQTRAGHIQQLAEQASWLCSSLSMIAEFKLPAIQKFLSTLALRLKYGVTTEGIYLATLRIPGLGRTYISHLVRVGLTDAPSIQSAGIEKLLKFIPEKTAKELWEKVTQTSPKEESSAEPVLIIDGEPKGSRFGIIFNQNRVNLTPKSFNFLLNLAQAQMEKPEGWIHKEELEPGQNQVRYLYRLKKELLPYLANGQNLIENNRNGSYRLGIKKERVKIEWERLRKIEQE